MHGQDNQRREGAAGRMAVALLLAISCALGAAWAQPPLPNDEAVELAGKLERLGYLESAAAHYERVLRDARLPAERRTQVEARLLAVQDRLAGQKEALAGLRPVEGLPAFAVTPVRAETARPKTGPEEFPPTRINKKAWVVGTVVVLAAVAYAVHRNAQKQPAPPPHPGVTVAF